MIQKNVLQRSFAIIADPTCNNRKRTLSLAAFDVSSCFAWRMIELAKNVPGFNRPLLCPGTSDFTCGVLLKISTARLIYLYLHVMSGWNDLNTWNSITETTELSLKSWLCDVLFNSGRQTGDPGSRSPYVIQYINYHFPVMQLWIYHTFWDPQGTSNTVPSTSSSFGAKGRKNLGLCGEPTW